MYYQIMFFNKVSCTALIKVNNSTSFNLVQVMCIRDEDYPLMPNRYIVKLNGKTRKAYTTKKTTFL